jgi:ribosomal-protein-alanine N-acetyltransferase
MMTTSSKTLASANTLQLRLCTIRPWTREDADAIQRYANNRNIWINLRDMFPHPYTLENAHAFLDFLLKEEPKTTFAIATDAEAIGCIGLRLGDDVHRKTAEMGYWLGEPFWGRGIMTEVVQEFIRWAFKAFDLQRIFAQPFADNTGSVRVLEKAGFICEGRMRANVFKDGKVLDSFIYARVRDG